VANFELAAERFGISLCCQPCIVVSSELAAECFGISLCCQ
jgi:hypothetical protein